MKDDFFLFSFRCYCIAQRCLPHKCYLKPSWFWYDGYGKWEISIQSDYKLGKNGYTDKQDPALYFGKMQGGKTVLKWRDAILADRGKRWMWLNE